MNTAIYKNWWLLALKGVLVMILGIIALAQPIEAMTGFAAALGFIMVIAGVLVSSFALINRSILNDWGWILFEGLFDTVMGLLIILYPGLTAVVLAILFGIWLLFGGGLQFAFALRHRKIVKQWQLPLFNGIIAFLLGALIVFNPLKGLIGLSLIIGISFLLFGLLMVYGAFKYRNKFTHTTGI